MAAVRKMTRKQEFKTERKIRREETQRKGSNTKAQHARKTTAVETSSHIAPSAELLPDKTRLSKRLHFSRLPSQSVFVEYQIQPIENVFLLWIHGLAIESSLDVEFHAPAARLPRVLDALANFAHFSSSVLDTSETLVAATHHGHAPLAAHLPSRIWLLLGHLELLPGELCLWTDSEAHVAGEILNVGELQVCHVLCPLVPDEAVAGGKGDPAVWLDNVAEVVTCLGETENIVKVQERSNVDHDVCGECFQSLAFSSRRL